MSRPAVLVARAVFPEVVERLAAHFEVEANPEDVIWSRAEFIAHLQGKAGVLTTGSERIDAELLAACPELRIVANMAVGYNNFDVPAMTAAGVLGTNAPDVLTETTADFGMALLLATARRVRERALPARGPLEDLALRHVPRRRGARQHAGHHRHGAHRAGGGAACGAGLRHAGALPQPQPPDGRGGSGLRRALRDQDELLRSADHVMLVLPYSAQAHHTIGAPELALMKPSATLVNLARGGIVDDAALALALRERRIAAAGLDVFEGEPRVHPDLLTVPNVVLTPHIASATRGTRLAMAQLAADNLIDFLTSGRARTPVNPETL